MIIIINGPCGVGKTTVADSLCSTIQQSVMLDGDYLGCVSPFEIYSESRIEHLYSTFAVNIAHHQSYGYQHFIINYVFESPESLKKLIKYLEPLDDKIFTFRLFASISEIQRRICKRATDQMEWELNRCIELTNIMEPFGDNLGERLDVTNLTPEEITKYILNKIKSSINNT